MCALRWKKELEKRYPRTQFRVEIAEADEGLTLPTVAWTGTANHPQSEALANDIPRLLVQIINVRHLWIVKKGSPTANALAKAMEKQTERIQQEREVIGDDEPHPA
jgi:hypothetical protein